MNIGIAGAGLLGRLLALSLLEKGYRVTLFDKDKKNGNSSCAMAAGGMLAMHAELERADLSIEKLGQRSILRWPSIIEKLVEPVYFRQQGSIVTAHSKDQADLARYIRKITDVLGDENAIQFFDNNRLNQIEPEITSFSRAYYFPQEGQIDNQQLMLSLQKTLEKENVLWLAETNVTMVEPKKISTEDKGYSFDHVFDCRGMGAQALFKDLRPVRGELIWLYAPAVNIKRPVRLIHPRYSLYIVPRPEQIYLVGASEIESADDSAISVKTLMELLSAAYSVHKGFVEARVIKTVVNTRPALADNLPSIKQETGLTAINGLYRHGFLIAPALVEDAIMGVC